MSEIETEFYAQDEVIVEVVEAVLPLLVPVEHLTVWTTPDVGGHICGTEHS